MQLEPPPTEIVVSTHPEQRSGWMRSNVIRTSRRAAGDIPVRHVIAADDADRDENNVLVVANETVISQELLDRVRARAAAGPGELPDRRAAVERRAEPRGRAAPSARALASSAPRGSTPTARSSIPDPFTATMEATHDERVDEIIVSTFPSARSGWLRRDLVGRLRARDRACRSITSSRREVANERARRADPAVTPTTGNANEHPPPIHYSSRINPVIVGIFLFIGSEIMLFGSFFTVYFFDRVVNADAHPGPWPPYIPGTHIQFERPWFLALVNTFILVTSSFTMHWATVVGQEGQPRRALRRDGADAAARARRSCSTQVIEYHRHRLQHERHGVRVDVLRADRPARLPRLRRPHDPARDDDPVVPRPLQPRAPSRDRGRRDLLALRRRDVDRGLRHRLRSVSTVSAGMRNPFRSEEAAFRFLC